MSLPESFAGSFARAFPDLVGGSVLVALSGGSDSVALLHLLAAASPRLGCRLRAAHVHHHLRGAEADADAELCASLCRDLDLPLAVLHLDPAPPRGTSPEAWWRSERYRLLEVERARTGCTAIATAHTLDDQAETVLLKLLRGSGPAGVAGIRRRRGAVVRPVLELRRDELRAWLRAGDLAWREDASNLAADRPRAQVRHRLLPAIVREFPRAVDHLGAFAAMLAEDERFLAAALGDAAARPAPFRPVPAAPVAALPPPLRRRWVLALAAGLPLAEPPSRAQLAAVDGLLAAGVPAAVDLGRRWVLHLRGARLHLAPPPLPPFASVAAAVPSETPLPGGLVGRIGTARGRGPFADTLGVAASGLRLRWRPPAPGERWAGSGGGALRRALAGAGVPAGWRGSWPLLDAGGTILWVPGVGVHPEWKGNGDRDIGLELEVPW